MDGEEPRALTSPGGEAEQVRRVGIVTLRGAGSAVDVLHRVRAEWPGLPVIVVAESAEPDEIGRWFDAGAADYVMPPFTRAAIVPRLLRLAAVAPAPPQGEIDGIVGRSEAYRQLVERIRAVARCDGTVLIEGETGSGKELCARGIHALSTRRRRPFHAINCGSIPRDLVENELFGHQRAAYTGAVGSHVGLIGEAQGGTLLFDEVDCFGHGEQATLLRFLQSGEYRPLGATRVHKADVRVLAATNANLADRVRQGTFREDLFYRLDMLRVHVPSLRERREDVPLIAQRALSMFAERFQGRARGFSHEAMQALIAHDWPGNVRELEHVVGRAVAFAFHEETIAISHLEIGHPHARPGLLSASLKSSKRRLVEDFERSRICAYLASSDGNIAEAARAACKNRRAFWELMRKYSIRAEDFAKPITRQRHTAP